MGITRSADFAINKLVEVGDSKYWDVYSGDSTKPFVNNKTYTAKQDEIGITLHDYSDYTSIVGSDVPGASGFDSNLGYKVYGSPFKYNYDILKQYNNSTVEAALNILSIAGLIDVKEKGNSSEYQAYLDTPIGTKKNSETGEVTTIYPKASKTESEYDLTKFAMENGYADAYMDLKYYKSGEDISGIDGATDIVDIHQSWGKDIGTIADIVYAYSKHKIQMESIKLLVEINEEEKESTSSSTSDSTSGSTSGTTSTTTTEAKSNNQKYSFAETIQKQIQLGRGIVVGGNACVFKKEDTIYYNPQTITIVGSVYGTTTSGESTFKNDIQGFYVVDTCGYLADAVEGSGVSYITVEQLYDFLTIYAYISDDEKLRWEPEPGETTVDLSSSISVTTSNIKIWADAMNLNGNKQHNSLIGNAASNVIHGRKSGDELFGRGGNDQLYGDEDNDTLVGGEGNDKLYGGSGNDTYVFDKTSGETHDTIVMGSGSDSIMFSSHNAISGDNEDFSLSDLTFTKLNSKDLQITYQNKDSENCSINVSKYFNGTDKHLKYLNFGAYYQERDNGPIIDSSMKLTDVLKTVTLYNPLYEDRANKYTGTTYNDEIIGGYKNDTINGASGNDTILAGKGNDVIKGGNGNDVIYATYGNDKIYGDAGENTIIFDASDTTQSGCSGHDTIYSGKGKDSIELYNVNKDNVKWAKNGNDLVIIYNTETGNSFTIANYFKNNSSSIESIKFEDDSAGTSLANFITPSRRDDSYLNQTKKWTSGYSSSIEASGKGDDKFYNYSNYEYTSDSAGSDVIYTSGSAPVTLDLTGTGVAFDETGATGCISNIDGGYSFTKSGNNLVINYATEEKYTDNRNITIANYFKSKNTYTIESFGADPLNLKDATIAFEGIADKSNKITGTSQNDYIVGKNYKDTLKGGAGDDTIVGGQGNDNITGGSGNNVIEYTKGDGSDTINLSKGENLTINMTDFASKDLVYSVSKNNLIISYRVDDYTTSKLFTFKNYGKSDITKGGNVALSLSDTTIDLPTADLGFKYSSFSAKKYKYSGKWLSETIDARNFSRTDKSEKGVKISANAGNDTIWGSSYNDTINGGAGDDVIITTGGKNTIQGGAGSDTYYILNGITDCIQDKSIITDSGANTDTDIVYSCINHDTLASEYSLWVNTSRGSNDFSIILSRINNGKIDTTNQIKISGVEQFGCIDQKDEDSPLSSGVDKYTFNIDQLKSDIAGWFSNSENTGYSSTADVYGAKNDNAGIACASLQSIFDKAMNNDGGKYWTAV